MRGFVLSLYIAASAVVPVVAAQIVQGPTAVPLVDASSAPWFVSGEPIFADGDFYYSTGPTVFFDGETMVRTGEYEGVPVYQDRTLEPFSIMYVPMGGKLMRPYERRRSGELAGTVGSRTPSFPVNNVNNVDNVQATPESSSDQSATVSVIAAPSAPERAATPGAPARASMESVPKPAHLQNGIYVTFAGARWYSSGSPRVFVANAFTPVGLYYGVIVYREKTGSRDRIWVPVVANGPVAPYSKR